ncbi:MAG: glycosyltransferase [Candidatus Pacebacteria bacterium]|nr:glycosyltransferase [Candidatus Paceibacterota bacterium]
MNIAIFTNNYLPNPYGVTGSVESFRKEFEKRGHAVFIFAPRFPEYVDRNPNVFRYPAIETNFKFRFPLAIPYSFRIHKILKDLEIDIIHAQHPNLLGSAAARWARKFTRRRGGKKVPLVFTWHTLYDHYAHFAKFVPKKLAAGYMIKKAARYANQADAVVVPTDSIIPILRKWGVTNKNIIPVATGVIEEEFENPDREVIRKKYNISNENIVLILITRLTAEKNIEFLFRAVKDILKKNKNIKFILGGGGYLLPEIEKLAREENISAQVILPGVIARNELKNYFAAGDILVDASLSETQGMHLSEGMYCGLPVVAVNATGIKSLVVNNGNGFLVKEDEKEFAAAVEKLIADANLRRRFAEVSRKIARAQFTSGVCAEKMLAVYQNCLNS